MATPPTSAERLQKALANHGLGSRREIEKLIEQGFVKVNGKVAKLGDKVTPEDKILFKGRKISLKKDPDTPDVLLYHKPVGQICSKHDPEGRDSVFDHLPRCPHGRWVIVGRLDYNTSGLLLFTSSGELANRLMHPRYEIEREYAVRIFGELTKSEMQKLIQVGVELDDGIAKLKSIKYQGGESRNHWYHVILSEGRNREVRRIFEAFEMTVSRLMRIRYGQIKLPPHLKQGQFELLDVKAVRKLLG